MTFALAELFWTGLVPFAAAAAIMLACRRVDTRPAIAWAAAVGASYTVGHAGLALRNGWHAALTQLLRPHEAQDWLPWLVLVALGVTVLAESAPVDWRRPIAALAALFIVVVPVRLLAGSVYVTTRWSAAEALAVLAMWSAALAAVWLLLAAGDANRQTIVRGGLLIAVAVGTAVTMLLSGAIICGEYCGVAAAALTGTLAAAIIRRPPNDSLRGAAGAVTVSLGGLILLGHFYASLHGNNAALLLAALAAAGGRLPTVWPTRPVGRAAFRLALCFIPLALALAIAWVAMPTDPYAS